MTAILIEVVEYREVMVISYWVRLIERTFHDVFTLLYGFRRCCRYDRGLEGNVDIEERQTNRAVQGLFLADIRGMRK